MSIFNTKYEGWFNYFLENPIKTWWKARNYFKLPRVSINFFMHPMYNCPYASFKWIGKIFDIRMCDVQWKTKYDDIRYERPPYIWICFFKRFGFSINFNTYYRDEFGDKQNLNDFYWEYLLNYIYRNLSLSTAYSICYGTSRLYSIVDYKSETKIPMKNAIPIVANSLNKQGILKLKSEINDRKS